MDVETNPLHYLHCCLPIFSVFNQHQLMANQLQKPLSTSPKPGLTKEEEQQDNSLEMVALQAERIVYSLTFPMVFKAALELGVIDTMAAIEDGTWLSPSELAFRLPTKPTNPEAPLMLDRMMRLLASHSILKCRVVETGENDQTGKIERVYAGEHVCKFFLKDSDGSGSLRSMFMPWPRRFQDYVRSIY